MNITDKELKHELSKLSQYAYYDLRMKSGGDT